MPDNNEFVHLSLATYDKFKEQEKKIVTLNEDLKSRGNLYTRVIVDLLANIALPTDLVHMRGNDMKIAGTIIEIYNNNSSGRYIIKLDSGNEFTITQKR